MRDLPLRKRSVFEACISTFIYCGNAGDVSCSLGLNLVLIVISLILTKPKRARVNAAQIILLSECDLGKSKSNMAQ